MTSLELRRRLLVMIYMLIYERYLKKKVDGHVAQHGLVKISPCSKII